MEAINGSNNYIYMLDKIIIEGIKRLSNPNIKIKNKDTQCEKVLSCIDKIKARIIEIDSRDILVKDLNPTVTKISQLISTTISFYIKTNPIDRIYIIAIIKELDSILDLIDNKINPKEEASKVNQLLLPKQIQA